MRMLTVSAFGIRPWLQKGLQGAAAAQYPGFNKPFNSARESNEWAFGTNRRLWSYLDAKRRLRMLQTKPALESRSTHF